MISVVILINGNPIMARSGTRTKPAEGLSGFAEYTLDDGSVIKHNPNKGAVSLAIAMLKTIKEVKR